MLEGFIIGIVVAVIAIGVFSILAVGKTIQNYYDKKENDNGNP